jgi:hypothetical protein
MPIRLEARTVLLILLACIALLTAAGFFVVFARFGLDHGRLFGISARFDLNGEGNVPAYYSALQIAFAALLLATIARAKRAAGDRYARHWVVLCVIFIFLSFDEAAELHERLREPMLARFELTGIWVYAWYIPYGILVALFATSYWRFFWHLPARTRVEFAGAAAIYVGAALGLELTQIHFIVSPAYGQSGALYAALSYSLEECLEMLGMALFVYALVRYAAQYVVAVRLEFSATGVRRERQT